MDDKVFSILCAVFSFLLSLVGSYAIYKIQKIKTREENAYFSFYYAFFVIWNSIHQGRAFNYYDLNQDEQKKISDFLFENELYADKELRDLIYELKCNQLNNFDDNDKTNILYANKAYNQIVDIILKREEKLRKKYVKVHDLKIKK